MEERDPVEAVDAALDQQDPSEVVSHTMTTMNLTKMKTSTRKTPEEANGAVRPATSIAKHQEAVEVAKRTLQEGRLANPKAARKAPKAIKCS